MTAREIAQLIERLHTALDPDKAADFTERVEQAVHELRAPVTLGELAACATYAAAVASEHERTERDDHANRN